MNKLFKRFTTKSQNYFENDSKNFVHSNLHYSGMKTIFPK